MGMYGIAAEFWVSVVSASLLLPLSIIVGRETRRSIEWLRHADIVEPAPHSHASAPSHPGL